MGITMWYASGALGGSSGGYNPRPKRPMTRSEKWSFAGFIFTFVVMPIIGFIAIVLVTVHSAQNYHYDPKDCCTLACRTEHHLPVCK